MYSLSLLKLIGTISPTNNTYCMKPHGDKMDLSLILLFAVACLGINMISRTDVIYIVFNTMKGKI